MHLPRALTVSILTVGALAVAAPATGAAVVKPAKGYFVGDCVKGAKKVTDCGSLIGVKGGTGSLQFHLSKDYCSAFSEGGAVGVYSYFPDVKIKQGAFKSNLDYSQTANVGLTLKVAGKFTSSKTLKLTIDVVWNPAVEPADCSAAGVTVHEVHTLKFTKLPTS